MGRRVPWRRVVPFALLGLALAGCVVRPKPAKAPGPAAATRSRPPAIADDHVPPFASQNWEPFSRAAAIAIAQREWRGFGSPVDDDAPDTRPEPAPEAKPERWDGFWQRVGEYWWEGLDPDAPEGAYTGKHDATGLVFDARQDGFYAWSAAFISYVMRLAGAGARFPYAPNHATYINLAASGAAPGLRAHDIGSYAPVPGDLICAGRDRAATLRFADLPTAASSFPSHCGIVTAKRTGEITMIGGNVDDAVTATHVPVLPNGALGGADGVPLDTRYPWLVVLQVAYETDGVPPPVN